jgi:hypothetical protein
VCNVKKWGNAGKTHGQKISLIPPTPTKPERIITESDQLLHSQLLNSEINV